MAKLHHFAITCSDFDNSLRFYTEGLGLGSPYLWNAPPLVERAAFIPADDGTWIELFDGGQTVAGGRRGPDAAGHSHVAIATDDVQGAFERIVAAGASVLEEPVTRTLHGDPPIQATMAFVAGPDGELIELYRNEELSATSPATAEIP